MADFYDIHMHITSVSHVPLTTFIKKYGKSFGVSLNLDKKTAIHKRIFKFINTSEHNSSYILNDIQKQIKESVDGSGLGFDKIIITPLLIYFEKEDRDKKIEIQIEDYKKAFCDSVNNPLFNDRFLIYPFLGIDPAGFNNTNEACDFIEKYVRKPSEIQNGDFIGIKLYPQLNMDIDKIDPEFFRFLESEKIPVTVHCAFNPLNEFKPKGFISFDTSVNQANELVNPLKWKNYIDRHNLKNLRLNLGHFGGDNSIWIRNVEKMIGDYENVYADISFYMSGMTYFNGKKHKTDYSFSNAIKKILKSPDKKKKVLYGSDYYPVITGLCDDDGEYKTYFNLVRQFLGDDDFKTISSINPKSFLGI